MYKDIFELRDEYAYSTRGEAEHSMMLIDNQRADSERIDADIKHMKQTSQWR